MNRGDAILATAIDAEMAAYAAARAAGDRAAAWVSIERAHILSQPRLGPHLKVHAQMLGFAIAERDGREAAGQALRLALAPLGALTGRLPWGNSGRARVSAFKPMPVTPDLRATLAAANVSLPVPGSRTE